MQQFKIRIDPFLLIVLLGFSAKTWASLSSQGLLVESVVLVLLVSVAFARSLRLLRRK